MVDPSEPHFMDRMIAVTDLETTGTDDEEHEIVDIGLVLADPVTLQEVSAWSAHVLPQHIHTAQARAMEINGYRPEDWQDALSLDAALRMYIELTEGAVFAAYNVAFDWGFVKKALRQTGLHHRMDYHRFCMFSTAMDRLRTARLPSYSMDPVAVHLGLEPEAKPHGALNGARKALEVYRRLALG